MSSTVSLKATRRLSPGLGDFEGGGGLNRFGLLKDRLFWTGAIVRVRVSKSAAESHVFVLRFHLLPSLLNFIPAKSSLKSSGSLS